MLKKNNNNNHSHTELIWDGKFEESVKLPQKRVVDKIVLPFQAIEVINEPREGTGSGQLFSGHKKEGWRNKLIWGDNKLVVSSLLKEYAGKIKLIYIDPPFFTGSNMPISIAVGEEESITKEPSFIEEIAYRNIWKSGLSSFCQWAYERLLLIKELLTEDGLIFIRFDWHYGHYIKIIADDVFGKNNFVNEIIVSRKRDVAGSRNKLDITNESIYIFAKSELYNLNTVLVKRPLADIKWTSFLMQGERKPRERIFLGLQITPPTGQHYSLIQEKCNKLLSENYLRLRCKKCGGLHYYAESGEDLHKRMKSKENKFKFYDITSKTNYFGVIKLKKCLNCEGQNFSVEYLGSEEVKLNTNWLNIPSYSNTTGYPTENSEPLLERVINLASNDGDLVADFFCGSGTTGAVAELSGRRWIMCDLGRFAIHTCRKRLMEIQRKMKEDGKNYYPFEILNLGKYERQHWQTALAGRPITDEGKKIAQYIKFIVELYRGEIISGFKNLHGKKNNIYIHIGAVDAPVTMNEIKEVVKECKENKLGKLDILAWEWEMGVNEEAIKWAKEESVRLRLLQIPREVMERKASESGEVKFFELDYIETEVQKKKDEVKVSLKNFAIPSEEYIPNELRSKITNWADYIDYWSVDWDYASKKDNDGNYIFENDWQTFRTNKTPKLELETKWHKYSKKGKYLILVKVIDIFGNDTSKVIEIKV